MWGVLRAHPCKPVRYVSLVCFLWVYDKRSTAVSSNRQIWLPGGWIPWEVELREVNIGNIECVGRSNMAWDWFLRVSITRSLSSMFRHLTVTTSMFRGWEDFPNSSEQEICPLLTGAQSNSAFLTWLPINQPDMGAVPWVKPFAATTTAVKGCPSIHGGPYWDAVRKRCSLTEGEW